MEKQSILKGLLGVIMIGCFLCQMWDLFDQFLSELKTVAVSYEEKTELEFPSFAFCDSRGFTKKIGITSNATLYNSTTFNVEVVVHPEYPHNTTGTCTVQYLPTIFNGYCKLFEFHRKYRVGTLMGKSFIVYFKMNVICCKFS